MFTVGGGVSTLATRLGHKEVYINPELNSDSTYCLVLIVYLESGIPNVSNSNKTLMKLIFVVVNVATNNSSCQSDHH